MQGVDQGAAWYGEACRGRVRRGIWHGLARIAGAVQGMDQFIKAGRVGAGLGTAGRGKAWQGTSQGESGHG